jgi:hypothetical protein
MANDQERYEQILKSMRVEPQTHGQISTASVGMRSQPEISPKRYEELCRSLENHRNNLIPIVVRRTTSLGDETDYEVIYGADWVSVAQKVGIKKLWAWVFDLTDEQVEEIRTELDLLLAEDAVSPKSKSISISSPPTSNLLTSELTTENLIQLIGSMLDQKLDQTLARLPNLTGEKDGNGGAIATLENKLELLERKINHLTDAISNLAHSVESLKIESLKQRPVASRSTKRSTKKTVDLDALAAKLKQFRQDPSSIPVNQLRDELNQRQVKKDCLQAWADELRISLPNKSVKKEFLIDRLLAF